MATIVFAIVVGTLILVLKLVATAISAAIDSGREHASRLDNTWVQTKAQEAEETASDFWELMAQRAKLRKSRRK